MRNVRIILVVLAATVFWCMMALVAIMQPAPGAESMNMINLTVASSRSTVVPGDTFDLELRINTDQPIAGIQFQLAFSPQAVKLNSVTEGTFLKQNSNQTYFIGGTIDNTAGSLKNVVIAVLGHGKYATGQGVVVKISGTALAAGNSNFALSKLITGNPGGSSVSVDSINIEQVTVQGRAVLSGTVAEQETGKEIANAQVMINISRFPPAADTIHCATDEQGAYRFEYYGLPGSYKATASCPADQKYAACTSPEVSFVL